MSKVKINKDKLLDALVKRAEGFYYSEEILEYAKVETKKSNNDNNDENITNLNSEEYSEEKNSLKNSVSIKSKDKKCDVYSDCDWQSSDKIQCSLSGSENENKQNLELLKKKVTTHYIPPDMSAIKMLIENFGETLKEENTILDGLTDDELLKMRGEIIKDLKEF